MLDHVGLAVSELAVSKAFYTRALAAIGYGLPYELSAEVTGQGAFVLDPDGHNIEAVCHLPG